MSQGSKACTDATIYTVGMTFCCPYSDDGACGHGISMDSFRTPEEAVAKAVEWLLQTEDKFIAGNDYHDESVRQMIPIGEELKKEDSRPTTLEEFKAWYLRWYQYTGDLAQADAHYTNPGEHLELDIQRVVITPKGVESKSAL